MKGIIFSLVITICLAPIVAQKESGGMDSLKGISFDWTIPTKGDWGSGPVETSITTSVDFFGQYKNFCVCDFTYNWKCDSYCKLYEMKNDSFVEINSSEFLNEKQSVLVDRLNKKVKKDLADLNSNPNTKDCAYLDNELPARIGDIQVSFDQDGVTLSYSLNSMSACDCCNGSSIQLTWKEALPYLRNPATQTPNYCTPSGPKVNIRKEPSVKAPVNFQLDRGEFFVIVEKGAADLVNEKKGHWLKIDYNGNPGYIFSFYTLCP